MSSTALWLCQEELGVIVALPRTLTWSNKGLRERLTHRGR